MKAIERVTQILGGATQICPITLRFQAEYPRARLPSIANLTTSHTTSGIMTPQKHCSRNVGPTIARAAITTVGADVEAAPVVDCGSGQRWGLGVRTSSQVSCGRGRSQCG